MIYFVLLIFALCLARVQYMITKFNMGALWNGYGAIRGVLDKKSDAPMVYRVLVPWLIGRRAKLWKYNLLQTMLIYLMLVSIFLVWGMMMTLLVLSILTITIWYDYWDWSVELIGLSLALLNLPLSIIGVFLLALSRETAPLIGLAYGLHSHDYLGGLFLSILAIVIMQLVRWYQGKHELYCERWMYKKNWQLIKSFDLKTWISILVCVMGLLGGWGRSEFIIIPIIIMAGWLMAKGNETRVFVAVVPYAALWINGLIK